jgi:S-adenosyl methyltransferase
MKWAPGVLLSGTGRDSADSGLDSVRTFERSVRDVGVVLVKRCGLARERLRVIIDAAMPDEEKPHQIIAEYRDHLAPGSYLALTHGITAETPEEDPEGVVQGVTNVYQNASAQMHVRSRKEIGRFFDGFEILEPGVVWTAAWRPEPGTRPSGRPDSLYGGVGRKPVPK